LFTQKIAIKLQCGCVLVHVYVAVIILTYLFHECFFIAVHSSQVIAT